MILELLKVEELLPYCSLHCCNAVLYLSAPRMSTCSDPLYPSNPKFLCQSQTDSQCSQPSSTSAPYLLTYRLTHLLPWPFVHCFSSQYSSLTTNRCAPRDSVHQLSSLHIFRNHTSKHLAHSAPIVGPFQRCPGRSKYNVLALMRGVKIIFDNYSATMRRLRCKDNSGNEETICTGVANGLERNALLVGGEGVISALLASWV